MTGYHGDRRMSGHTPQLPPPFPHTPKQFRPPTYGETVECEGRLYQLGGQIGQGAFGMVYECTDDWGNDLVAKVMLPNNRPYEAIRARWVNEATNLSALRHPNITYVHDAFEYRDTFYVIIERMSANLTSYPMVRGDAWVPYVARDVLQGIDFIHSRGYAHKDLHPGNILVREVGNAMLTFKIGDLGIANLQTDMTKTMAPWMLPPEFLSPEVFGALGPQTDIYHAGLLFLSLLLDGPANFTRDQIIGGYPAHLARGLRSPYALSVAAALNPYVAQRTQTARDFWRALRHAATTASMAR